MADSEQIDNIDRRDFLRYILLAAGVSIVGGGAYLYGKRVDLDDPISVKAIRNQFSDLEPSLRFIGEKYREIYPGELTESGLLKEINEKLLTSSRNQTLFADLCDLVEEQVYMDYLHSDFVQVESWMITKTEAQICALISI